MERRSHFDLVLKKKEKENEDDDDPLRERRKIQ